MNRHTLDQFDIRILNALQDDSSISQRDLAERVGLSQNACWRRLRAIRAAGVVTGQSIRLNRQALGLGVVAFVMIRTSHHSRAWLEEFRQHVHAIPEVIDFYRIAGNYDYMLKIVTYDIKTYDDVYQRIIDKVELDTVTSYLAMEAIEDQRPFRFRE